MVLKNFLSHQQFHVRIKDTFSEVHILDNSVLQEQFLVSSYPILPINDIASIIHQPIKIKVLADALALILPYSTPQIGKAELMTTLVNLQSSALNNTFTFSSI